MDLTFRSEHVELRLLPEMGGRIDRLRAFGIDVLRTPDHDDRHVSEPFFWGAHHMAPWCNRIGAVPTAVLGRELDLMPNFPDGTAIHGQVYNAPWTVIDDNTLRVAGGGDEWPWPYEIVLRVTIGSTSVQLEYTLTNSSDSPMPAGLGIHPWFKKPVEIVIPSHRVFADNAATSPEPQPVAGPFDLCSRGPMTDDLDATWMEPDRDTELFWSADGLRATLSTTGDFIVAASPRPIDAIAVEPQTHAPDGVRRLLNDEEGALAVLGSGESLAFQCWLGFTKEEP